MTDRIDTAKERERLANSYGPCHEHILRAYDFLDALDAERAENERLREALVRMVEELACDDPECDICAPARAALNWEGETTSGSSKWGPQFPPASCTAYEDCAHDGVCHDPNCGAPSQHGKGEA